MKQPTNAERSGGAVALINDVIEKAVKKKASDIHFEPQEALMKIRYRVDGLLCDGFSVHRSMIPSITARIKVMVNLDIGETRLPQDGRTRLNVDGAEIDLRISTLPTIFGEKAVIRLLEAANTALALEALGMEGNCLKKFKQSIGRPNGLVIVSGSTGCGKTTTLYAALDKLNSTEKNITTIEDPVEYRLAGINQVHVNEKTGLTFSKGLRAILRQDPDIIMIGEIRDQETAGIAVAASMTGHLVLATLHTKTASGAPQRLIDMGIEPYLVASSLTAVLSQRLVRKKCHPCAGCSFLGYKGRIAIFEFLEINDKIRELILKRAGPLEIEKSSGLFTMLSDGFKKAEE
ncbi:MAG: GspE/PulE family protein, partial [Candidatus Margulisiibacteriota bacterium]